MLTTFVALRNWCHESTARGEQIMPVLSIHTSQVGGAARWRWSFLCPPNLKLGKSGHPQVSPQCHIVPLLGEGNHKGLPLHYITVCRGNPTSLRGWGVVYIRVKKTSKINPYLTPQLWGEGGHFLQFDVLMSTKSQAYSNRERVGKRVDIEPSVRPACPS